MECPSCHSEMQSTNVGELDVLECSSCKCVWLTQGQSAKIDWDLFSVEEKEVEEVEQSVCCSACSIPLHWHKFPTALQVRYPECYDCGGMLLSPSMILEIRDHSMSEAQRNAYLEQISHSVPGYIEAETQMKMRAGASGFGKSWQKFKARFKRS